MKTNTKKNEPNVKKETTARSAKAEKAAKACKSGNKTRAEVRQAVLMEKTLKEAERVEGDASDLFDKLYSLDSKDLTPIDRHLLTLQLHAMESYASTLRTIYAFESVRTRRRGGEFLRKGKEGLLRFIYGAYAPYETGCACGKACEKAKTKEAGKKDMKNVKNVKADKTGKKEAKARKYRPAKVVSAVVAPGKVKLSAILKPAEKKASK